jgi:hypothetical protein
MVQVADSVADLGLPKVFAKSTRFGRLIAF